MSKRVQVTIEMDEEFIAQLKMNVGLSGLGNNQEHYKRHTASQALAVVVMMEARGAYPEQVHSAIPHEWRPNIEAVHDQRKVIES